MAVFFPNIGNGLTRDGSFLDPAQNWTKARWVWLQALPGTYATIWQLGGGSPPSTETPPWVWSGVSVGTPDGFNSQGDIGGGPLNDTGIPASAGVWAYVATRYTASTKTITTVVNGVIGAGGFVLDLSAVPPQTSEWLGTDSVSDAQIAFAYDRSWQALLTPAELQAERASAAPVRTANLLSNTPLVDASDLADTVNGHDWTVNGTMLTHSGPFAQVLTPGDPVLYLAWLHSPPPSTNTVTAFNPATGAVLADIYQNTDVADLIEGLAADATNYLYIGHAGDGSQGLVDVYDPSGRFVRQIDTGVPDILGIMPDPATGVYVCHLDGGNLGIVQHYRSDGTLLATFDTSGCSPRDLAGYMLRVIGSRLYTGDDANTIAQYSVAGTGTCLPYFTSPPAPVYTFSSMGQLPSGQLVTTSDTGDPFDVRILSATGDVLSELKGPNWAFASESATFQGWYDGTVLWLLQSTDHPIVQSVDPLAPQTALVTLDLSDFPANFDVQFVTRNQAFVPPTPPDLQTVTRRIRMLRQTSHLWSGKNNHRLRYPGFELLVESGVPVGADGDEPLTISLQWSDDGGHTWSNPITIEGAKVGQYRYRFRWFRLGVARDRVFRVYESNNAKMVWLDALLDPDPEESAN